MLTTNRNLLIVADMLVVNKGFAEQQPKMVAGSCRDCSKATGWSAISRTRISTSSAARSSGRASEAKEELRRCTCRTCRRTSRSSPARSTRPAASAASFSRRSRLRQRLIKDPPGCRALRRSEASAGAREDRALQGTEGRDRADPLGGGDRRRDRSAPEQGHPLPVRAELVDARPADAGEPQEPRGDQEAPAGQPGIDRAAARPRRQRAGGRVPQAGRRSLRADAGAAARWSSARSARTRSSALLIEKYKVDAKRLDVVGRGWEEPSAPIRRRIGASKCSGSRSSERPGVGSP